jgi:hypothetical protein
MTKLFQACCLDGNANELDNIQARVRHGRYRLHEAEICLRVLQQVKLLRTQMVGERRGDLLARLEEDIDEQIAERMAWDPTDITLDDWVELSLSSEGSPVARRVREEEDEEQAMIEERERGYRRRGGEGRWAERGETVGWEFTEVIEEAGIELGQVGEEAGSEFTEVIEEAGIELGQVGEEAGSEFTEVIEEEA